MNPIVEKTQIRECSRRIGQDGCRDSTLRLLEQIAALDLNRLRVEEA